MGQARPLDVELRGGNQRCTCQRTAEAAWKAWRGYRGGEGEGATSHSTFFSAHIAALFTLAKFGSVENLTASLDGVTGEGWAREWISDIPSRLPISCDTSYPISLLSFASHFFLGWSYRHAKSSSDVVGYILKAIGSLWLLILYCHMEHVYIQLREWLELSQAFSLSLQSNLVHQPLNFEGWALESFEKKKSYSLTPWSPHNNTRHAFLNLIRVHSSCTSGEKKKRIKRPLASKR